MRLTFQIEVHIDDVEILYKIAKTLGVGNVYLGKTRPTATFNVSKFGDITSVIIPIFKEFPLQTTKYLDFISFMDAALIILNSDKERLAVAAKNLSKRELVQLKKLKESMNSGRLEKYSKQEKILKKKVSINK